MQSPELKAFIKAGRGERTKGLINSVYVSTLAVNHHLGACPALTLEAHCNCKEFGASP